MYVMSVYCFSCLQKHNAPSAFLSFIMFIMQKQKLKKSEKGEMKISVNLLVLFRIIRRYDELSMGC